MSLLVFLFFCLFCENVNTKHTILNIIHIFLVRSVYNLNFVQTHTPILCLVSAEKRKNKIPFDDIFILILFLFSFLKIRSVCMLCLCVCTIVYCDKYKIHIARTRFTDSLYFVFNLFFQCVFRSHSNRHIIDTV